MASCNIMTGAGFGMDFLGGFAMAWLGMVILFFIIIFTKKWIGEEMGVGFNTIFAFVGGYIPYLILISMTCSYKYALGGGLIGAIVGGFLLGQFIDTGGDF